jgi:hypothetical protein
MKVGEVRREREREREGGRERNRKQRENRTILREDISRIHITCI